MKKIIRVLTSFIIILGILITCYPVISQIYYNIINKQEIIDFNSGSKTLSESEISNRIVLARDYNKSLRNVTITDPYTREKIEKGLKEYARMLEINEKIGSISIPAIGVNLPIFAGTSENVLQKGVGHLEGTSLPIGGKNTHSVLTAHTGLPKNRLFTDLNKVKIGHKFFITNIKEVIAYEVDSITVITPTQIDKLAIIPGKDYVTLLTCTPYMINSHRLLVRGHRVPYHPKDKETNLRTAIFNIPILYIAISFIILILSFILFKMKLKRISAKDRRMP